MRTHEIMDVVIQEVGGRMPVIIFKMTLGSKNQGTIGPTGTPEEIAAQIEAVEPTLNDPANVKEPTNCWVCVDRRYDPKQRKLIPEGMADPQTAGGMVLTLVSIEYMCNNHNPAPLSLVVAAKTAEVKSNGQEPAVHGDEHNLKAGCGLNSVQRQVLRYNYDNKGSVIPITKTILNELGIQDASLDKIIEGLIDTGKENADNDALWDVDPAGVVDIAFANGAEYHKYTGLHDEDAMRIDLSENAYEHVSAFNFSAGRIKKYFFDLAEAGVISHEQALLNTAGSILHNIGAVKRLGNKNIIAFGVR